MPMRYEYLTTGRYPMTRLTWIAMATMFDEDNPTLTNDPNYHDLVDDYIAGQVFNGTIIQLDDDAYFF